jgi:hypothetical protein
MDPPTQLKGTKLLNFSWVRGNRSILEQLLVIDPEPGRE